MIFITDLNLDELHALNKLHIILVDHHYLHSKFNDLVVEIIDHHQIKQGAISLQEYVQRQVVLLQRIVCFCSSSAIRIEPVGSCCTLIAEKIFSSNFQMTEEIAYFLMGKSARKR